MVFFTIHCNPSFAYIAVRETFKVLNAMRVYSHSYWLVIFCTTNSIPVLARGRWQTFEKKNAIFKEHPVYFLLDFGMNETEYLGMDLTA